MHPLDPLRIPACTYSYPQVASVGMTEACAHIVHQEASELITGYGLASALEATEEDLMHTVFAHPTLSEALHESVLAAFGRAVHG